MTATDRLLVLPPRPRSEPSARLREPELHVRVQKYVIDVCDALVRACRVQGPLVRLPEPRVVSTHFGAFTENQARFWSAVLCEHHGAVLVDNRGSRKDRS